MEERVLKIGLVFLIIAGVIGLIYGSYNQIGFAVSSEITPVLNSGEIPTEDNIPVEEKSGSEYCFSRVSPVVRWARESLYCGCELVSLRYTEEFKRTLRIGGGTVLDILYPWDTPLASGVRLRTVKVYAKYKIATLDIGNLEASTESIYQCITRRFEQKFFLGYRIEF